jgi:hypothetical protein
MAHMRNPQVLAGTTGASEAFLAEPPEDSNPDCSWQQVGAVASGLLLKLAARHNLTADRALTVARLAGLGGVTS